MKNPWLTMVDIVSKKKISKMMSGIHDKDTRPELKIRSALHKLGYRYKLHDKHIPGKPDLVLPKYNAAILIHGCFWHPHNYHLFKWLLTRPEYWKEKISGNKKRDERNLQALKEMGWSILIIWECALKGKNKLDFGSTIKSISDWLKSSNQYAEITGTK
jgi:DNA mismatch endonuclease (patch repair protein)